MPGDAESRVVIAVRPTQFVPVDHGLTAPELDRIVKARESLRDEDA